MILNQERQGHHVLRPQACFGVGLCHYNILQNDWWQTIYPRVSFLFMKVEHGPIAEETSFTDTHFPLSLLEYE